MKAIRLDSILTIARITFGQCHVTSVIIAPPIKET